MPIKRINQFVSGSGTLTGDDIFLMMDDPDGSAVTKQVSLNQIIESSNAVISDISVVNNSGEPVDNVITLTQSEYDNIVPQSGVIYLISDAAPVVRSDISVVSNSGTVVDNVIILDQSTYNNIAPQSGVVYMISEDTFQGDGVLIDGSGNNYNPGGVTDTVRISGINTPILTGLSYTDYNNDAGLFINVGSNDIIIKHNDSNSSASNRFLVPWAGDYNVSASGGSFLAVRDKTDNVWRIV